jgi:high-affinity nickel permease
METKDTDKLLKDFFGEHKQEIQDKGFTQRVMRKLPEQADRSWIVWCFALVGMVLSLMLGFSSGSIHAVISYLFQMPVYYLIGAIFCFPLISTAGLLIAQYRRF